MTVQARLASAVPSSPGSVTPIESAFLRVTAGRAHPAAFPRSCFPAAKAEFLLLCLSHSPEQTEKRNVLGGEAGSRDKLWQLFQLPLCPTQSH